MATAAGKKIENMNKENIITKIAIFQRKEIRKTIQKLGGTMPEKLPTPEHIKESKKRIKTSLKKIAPKK